MKISKFLLANAFFGLFITFVYSMHGVGVTEELVHETEIQKELGGTSEIASASADPKVERNVRKAVSFKDTDVDEEEEAKKLTGEKSSISYSKRTTLNRLYEEDVEYRSFRNTLDDLKKTERSKKLMKILSGLDKDQMGKEIRQQFCGENKTAIQNAMKQTRDTVKSSKLYKKGGKYLSLDQISKFYNVLEYCFNVEQKYEVKLHRVLNKFCNKNVYPWASGILTKANITYKNCNLVLKSTDLKKESFFKNLCLCFKEKEEDEEKEDWFEEENVEEGETHVGSPILHGKCLKESTLKMGGNGLSDIAVQSHNYPMG